MIATNGPKRDHDKELTAPTRDIPAAAPPTTSMGVSDAAALGGARTTQLHVVIIGPDPVAIQTWQALTGALENFQVKVFPNVAKTRTYLDNCATSDTLNVAVPVMVLTDQIGNIDEAVTVLSAHRLARTTRFVLATERKEHDDVSMSVDLGRLVAIISEPVSDESLLEQITAQIDRWLRRNQKEYPDTAELLSADQRALELPEDDLLSRLELSSEELVGLLLSGIERVLGYRPRLNLPAGVRLTRQGQPVDAVYLVLEGSVSMHWTGQTEDVLLHHASSGPLIGLVSLARRQLASVTSRTATAVQLVRVSIEQLDHVLTQAPEVSALLAVVAIRALTTRLMRAEVLHVEKEELSSSLQAERERLTHTLAELKQTRAELVGAARFAMLGELSAGLAHELNNPVAAIVRSAEFVAADLEELLERQSATAAIARACRQAREQKPRSTSDHRAAVRELIPWVGDRQLAQRLIAAGIEDPRQAREIAAHPHELERLELAANIGTSVRNITTAGARITGLVSSLRSYARPDTLPVDGVDLQSGIDDALRLTASRMHGIEIIRDYCPDLPLIRAYPAQLEQVWTNLLVNAAEALLPDTPTPQIQVRVSATDNTSVKVQVCDNGPGIPLELQEKVFLPHFTTKSGTVRFGLGMGLGIANKIIEAHGGSIKIDSRPGRTQISVHLPISGPALLSLQNQEHAQASTNELSPVQPFPPDLTTINPFNPAQEATL